MRYKLRYIVGSNSNKNAKKVKGLTIPNEIAVFFEGCYFSVQRSGTCIMLHSGTNQLPTKQEVENYNFSDCRV